MTQRNMIHGKHRESVETTLEAPLKNDGVYVEGYIENVRFFSGLIQGQLGLEDF